MTSKCGLNKKVADKAIAEEGGRRGGGGEVAECVTDLHNTV